MNAVRAESFLHRARVPLVPATAWPRLPAHLTLDRVVGVAVNSRGLIYVAHRGEHPLLCLHPDGTLAHEVGADAMRQTTAYDLRGPVPVPIATRCWLHGLHVDHADNVWITDVGRHLVMKFDASGKLVLTLGVDGESGCDARRFAQPTHVCVVPSGEFFVTDGYGNSRVAKFSADGKFLFDWGQRGTGAGEFHTPHVIVLGRDGLLYLTDRENDRVQVFDQQGKFRAEWPGLHSVDGLWPNADGTFFAAAGMDRAVLHLDQDGRVLDAWANLASLRYPHAIARSSAGALYIADTGDIWVIGSRKPGDQQMVARTGPEGSALVKLVFPSRCISAGPACFSRRKSATPSSTRTGTGCIFLFSTRSTGRSRSARRRSCSCSNSAPTRFKSASFTRGRFYSLRRKCSRRRFCRTSVSSA